MSDDKDKDYLQRQLDEVCRNEAHLLEQLAAYRALLTEAHELLARVQAGDNWPTQTVADLLDRIEAVVGKDGEGE